MSQIKRIREIPYNYTSFSDREIVIRFLGENAWKILQSYLNKRGIYRNGKFLGIMAFFLPTSVLSQKSSIVLSGFTNLKIDFALTSVA